MRLLGKLLSWCSGWGVALAVLLSLGGGVGQAMAAETPDYRILASPATLDLELEPGKTTTTKFTIANTGAKEFDFTLSMAPYSVEGDDYRQDFTTVTKYNDLVEWVTFSQDGGTLEAGEEVEITATIKVPMDVPDGGQYAVILAKMSEKSSDEQGGSAIKAEKQVGILTYSKNVKGVTREEGKILDVKVPSFMFAPPISATSTVENDGNVHAKASYTLQVFPMFGDEEVYTNEEHPDELTILPGTRRFNTMSWDGAPKLGIFRVKQTVKFLGQSEVVEKMVFICPIWFLLIVLAIIFLAIFGIVMKVRGKKGE